MAILGVEEISYGADDLSVCRKFFLDWGLTLVAESAEALSFETLNGARVIVESSLTTRLPPALEAGPSLRQVVWGVDTDKELADLETRMQAQPGFLKDCRWSAVPGSERPVGEVRVSRKKQLQLPCASYNTWHKKDRVNAASPAYDRATPIEIGHVVFFVNDVAACEKFYSQTLGFRFLTATLVVEPSCVAPHAAAIMTCSCCSVLRAAQGSIMWAFAVRDIHEVFGGGLHMSRCGWDTQLGPGRHPISSAYFWYFKNPAGALVEYYTDADELTEDWTPRDFEPGPTVFAEWAIEGGIDAIHAGKRVWSTTESF